MFLLGCFTVVRLVDTSVENIVCLRGIARIRRYHLTLTSDAIEYFPTSGTDGVDAQSMVGATAGRSALWYTTASTIGMVNAVLGGTVTALVLEGVFQVPRSSRSLVPSRLPPV